MTFRQFAATALSVPASTSWYLADLGEARGKQREPQVIVETAGLVERQRGIEIVDGLLDHTDDLISGQ